MAPNHRWRIVAATVLLAPPRSIAAARADVVWQILPDACARTSQRSSSLWCRTRPARAGAEVRAIGDATRRMRARGGVCASLAATIDALQLRGRLRLFDPEDFHGIGGLAPRDGHDPWIFISSDFIMRYTDAAHASGNIDSDGRARPETLQLILAHEADHLRGLNHIDRDGYLTPHALACSDLSA
jgi:hypothetical protein